MLKIWGRENSINVQKVMWVVEELGIAHQRIDAGLQYGLVNEPWYRAMNPNGRVPTIDDDGFVLWESNAIVRYLVATHGAGRMAAPTPQAHAMADSWMDWASSTLAPPMTTLFWGLIRTPPEARNLESIETARQQLEQVMTLLDAQLARHDYIAGDVLTVGDVPAGCFVQRWLALPIAHGQHPSVVAWHARLARRPAYRARVMLPLS